MCRRRTQRWAPEIGDMLQYIRPSSFEVALISTPHKLSQVFIYDIRVLAFENMATITGKKIGSIGFGMMGRPLVHLRTCDERELTEYYLQA